MSFKYYYKNMIIFLNNYKITKYFNKIFNKRRFIYKKNKKIIINKYFIIIFEKRLGLYCFI
jgi:hypothetical protein